MDEILEVKCGPEKHDALMTMKVSWADEPCATKSFEEMHKWTSKYFLKPFMGIDQGQSFNLFLAGRAAMMLEGNWLVGQLRNANKLADYGVFPVPRAPRASMALPSTTTSARRARIRTSRRSSSTISKLTPVQQANLGHLRRDSVNKDVKSDSTEPLDLAWKKIFGEFNDVFVNGDQAFPLDVTTEYLRVINEVASDHLDPKDGRAANCRSSSPHESKLSSTAGRRRIEAGPFLTPLSRAGRPNGERER